MKSLQKRLEKIEARNVGKDYKPPYLAIVSNDGTVNVSHVDEDDFQLPNKEALDNWMEDNNLNESDCLKVIVVNSRNAKGKPPEVK